MMDKEKPKEFTFGIKSYLQLILVGVISQFSFLTFIVLVGFTLYIIFFIFGFLDIEMPTYWFYLICSLLFLLLIAFVYKKSKKEVIWRMFLFGLIPTFISAVFYTVIPYFAMELTKGWSGLEVFSIDPFKVHTIPNLNVPILFVPKDTIYIVSVFATVAIFLLSLFLAIKKFGHYYLPASISAIFSLLGAILFFDFLNYSILGEPGMAGAYVPLLLSGILLLNYFSFREYSISILIRCSSIFILFLSLGIIQDFGLGHLPILWTPIDFTCLCLPAMGALCYGVVVILWWFFILLPIGCFEAYLMSWISAIVYWTLLSRLIIFAYDKFKTKK